MPSVLRRFSIQERRLEQDRARERRLELVIGLVDRLIYDIARMCAGHAVVMDDYVLPAVSRRLSDAVRPFLERGRVLHPDFGTHAELRVEGDLLQSMRPVLATVEFDDASAMEDFGGELRVVPNRRITMHALISLDHSLVQRVSLSIGPPSPA